MGLRYGVKKKEEEDEGRSHLKLNTLTILKIDIHQYFMGSVSFGEVIHGQKRNMCTGIRHALDTH